MLACTHCNNILTKGSTYCSKCGEKYISSKHVQLLKDIKDGEEKTFNNYYNLLKSDFLILHEVTTELLTHNQPIKHNNPLIHGRYEYNDVDFQDCTVIVKDDDDKYTFHLDANLDITWGRYKEKMTYKSFNIPYQLLIDARLKIRKFLRWLENDSIRSL